MKDKILTKTDKQNIPKSDRSHQLGSIIVLELVEKCRGASEQLFNQHTPRQLKRKFYGTMILYYMASMLGNKESLGKQRVREKVVCGKKKNVKIDLW